MKPNIHSLLGKLPNAALLLLFSALFSLLGCQQVGVPSTLIVPKGEITIGTPSLLTETPFPDCMDSADINITAALVSEFSVHLEVTGLQPNESVLLIFRSKTKTRELETRIHGAANENGFFEYTERVRGPGIDADLKLWEIQLIHSRGSACTEFILP